MAEGYVEKKGDFFSKKVLIVIATILVAIIAATSAYCSYVVSAYGGGDKIGRGIKIDGINVGNMSVQEAADAVLAEKAKLGKNTVDLSLGGESTIAKFDEFDITYKAMDAAQNAFDCGKRGGIFGRINKCFKI
ncbi:MAG: hypothetical protein Q8873_06975, partial [Bacillota bacterium]|nr:hypothetical protein [Bacillota bacterium]